MNTTTIPVIGKEIAQRKPKTSPRQRTFATVAISTLLVAAALIFLGMKIEDSRITPPLPSNQQCINATDSAATAVKTFNVQLSAALQGKDAPAPDLSQIKASAVACRQNVSNYQVTVGGNK